MRLDIIHAIRIGLINQSLMVYYFGNKNIYVVDNLNSDVTVFNSQGDYFKKAGYGPDSLKIMLEPCAVAVDKRGVLYVCDRGNSSIYRYQLSNSLDEDIKPED